LLRFFLYLDHGGIVVELTVADGKIVRLNFPLLLKEGKLM
jgi:hypothetical protein